MKINALLVHPDDDVATVLKDINEKDTVLISCQSEETTLTSLSSIPFGHKIAIKNIQKGDKVKKYGETIGKATSDIQKGEHVHVHNLDSARARGDREVVSE